MAVITGTVAGITNVRRNDTPDGARCTARLACNFAAYTGSSDSGGLSSVAAAIQAVLRNGKTITPRFAMCVGAGADTNLQAVYTGAITISATPFHFTFDLTTLAGTELTSSTATIRPVQIDVAFDES
jgi:hypothetical protein